VYTYPEALNAMEKIATDLCTAAFPDTSFSVRVVADSITGTASVDWNRKPEPFQHCYVTINMPVRRATYRMSADEFRHWAGYLLHEVGHPFETDKVQWTEAVAEGKHKLLNSLEDVREELCTIRRGIAKNAVKVFSDLIDMMHAKAVAEGYNPNEINSIGWTLSSLGRRANGYTLDLSDIDRRLDPNSIAGKVVAWALDELAACTSTSDCRVLSGKIIDFVNAERRKAHDALNLPEPEIEEIDPEAEPEEFGGQNETRGKEDEDEVQPDNTPVIPEEEPKGPGQPTQKDEDAQSPEGEVVDAGSPEDAGAPESDEEEKSPEDNSPEEFTDADVEEVDLTPTEEGNLTSANAREAEAQKRITGMMRRVLKGHGVRENEIKGRSVNGSVDLVTTSAAKMGVQRALLARCLKANDNEDHDTGRKHGRLNRRALHRLASGNNAIFGRRTITEGYDTDVQILVDGSGSMQGRSIQAASTLALVVAQAAAQVGVDCTTHLFNDEGLLWATKGRAKPLPKKFAYMQNNITGSTPLSESILLASHLQHKRSGNKRRILFVITDGGCNSGPDVLKAAAQYVETLGTEVANLHIGSKVMGVFRNEVAVNVQDVSKTGLKQLTAVLERGA